LARLRLFGWKVRLLTVHVSSRSKYIVDDREIAQGLQKPASQHQHPIERRFAAASEHRGRLTDL